MPEGRAGREKELFRAHLRRERSALDPAVRERADAQIERTAAALPEFIRADVVFAYCSFGSEVSTRGLIETAWAAGKTVALPRCVAGTRSMEWYETRSFDGLEKSSLGVREPQPDPSARVDPAVCGARALAIVPGLAFDRRGFRIGYGAGFYDAFLADFPGVSAGLCRDAFLLDRLEALECHDRPVDIVVTQSSSLR